MWYLCVAIQYICSSNSFIPCLHIRLKMLNKNILRSLTLSILAILVFSEVSFSQYLDTSQHVLNPVSFKISSQVKNAVWLSRHDTSLAPVVKMESSLQEIAQQHNINTPPLPSDFTTWAKIDANNKVFVYLYPASGSTSQTIVNKLQAMHVPPVAFSPNCPTISVWIPIDTLGLVAAFPEVGSIRLVTDPFRNIGPIFSQGDALMRGPMARGIWPNAQGQGITVGVLSDDCGSKELAGNSLLSSVNVLDDSYDIDKSTGAIAVAGLRTHEGLAMLDLVHDVAPASALAFAQGVSNITDFCTNIYQLANRGNCSVLCDDITFFEEPFFEDGDIANTIHDVVRNQGVFYVTSAGNFANEVDSFNFVGMRPPAFAGILTRTHAGEGPMANNFNGLPYNQFYLPGGMSCDIRLQWDEPFHAPVNNFRLLLYDVSAGQIVYTASSNDEALETIQFTNNGSSDYYNIIVELDGSIVGNPRLVLLVYNSDLYFHPAQKNGALSILGHAMSADVMTCGAVDASSPTFPEPFSSMGPSNSIRGYSFPGTVASSTRTDRHKPDVVAPDDVSTTVPGWSSFSGTSAAAPHVAGLAALVRSALVLNHKTNTASRTRTCILNGIADAYPGTKWSPVMGNGLVDAVTALTEAEH
jgi:subtilisin family serine protease